MFYYYYHYYLSYHNRKQKLYNLAIEKKQEIAMKKVIVRGIAHGAIILVGNSPEAIAWWAIVLGGNCPGGNCPGGSCPRTSKK